MKIITNLILILIFFSSCKTQPETITGKIIRRACLDCFEENTLKPDSSLANCEASAGLYLDGNLYVAGDKPVPEHSSVFRFSLNDSLQLGAKEFLDYHELISAFKFEDFSVLPDNKTILLSTGFDRIRKDTNSWDRYNCLLYWDKNTEDNVKILAKVDNKGVLSSARLRPYFKAALADSLFVEGPEYFKIEGITAISDNKLLFGVREKGKDYMNFEYVIDIISVSYFWSEGEIILKNDFTKVYTFTPQINDIESPVGLSSLEYDRENERLFVLTSFEKDETAKGVGGYLWHINIEDFHKSKPLKLVRTKAGKPIRFAHKSEGIALVDSETLIIIHDDDRRTGNPDIKNPEVDFYRKPHQAAYTIVKID